MRTTAEITSLADAVADLVNDGDTVALEGFTHLIPVAAGQEIIRQRKRDLTLVRMTPGHRLRPADRRRLRAQADLLLGRQPGRRLAAPLPRGGPERQRRSRSRSTATRAWRTATSPPRRDLPFAVLRGYNGTSLPEHTDTIKPITCPFTGEQLTAVPALDLDVGIIHAQQADKQGNVQLWGQIGVQKETVLGAKRSARHRRGDRRRARADGRTRVVLPRWVVDPRRATSPAAPSRPTRRTTTTATTQAYKDWDAVSQGPRASSPPGWRTLG